MHPRILALGLATLVGAAGVTGCGGSDDDSDSGSAPAAGQTATVPEGNLAASSAPPRLGYYAGVDCGRLAERECDDLEKASLEGYTVFCGGGKPHREAPASFTRERDGKREEFNYFCFTLRDKQTAANFFYGDAQIVKSVNVSSDRFPETCEAGYCVQGEWFGTTRVVGKVRNPNGVSSAYRAVRIGGLS